VSQALFQGHTEEQQLSKIIRKTNPRILGLITDLRALSRDNGVNIWRDIAKRLERPTRNYSEVNLSKINRYTIEDETVIVPGKVLSSGNIEHKVIVAALGFSDSAKEKIMEKGGSCLNIEDLVKENPNGSGVKIMQ
jgi:large subunit ribosomal protein L18e